MIGRHPARCTSTASSSRTAREWKDLRPPEPPTGEAARLRGTPARVRLGSFRVPPVRLDPSGAGMTSSVLSRARLFLFLGMGVASSAMAVLPHAPAGLSAAALAQLGEPPLISPAIDAEESKQWAATDTAFRAFV